MTPISHALDAVRTRISSACRAAGRDPAGVGLIAVSKTVAAERIAEALAAGQRDFGENYVQEALEKMRALPRDRITWHYIGPIQSNKTAEISEHFDWVHGVDREKIARRLSEQRPPSLPPLNVCVQVNISGEASKSGLPPAQTAALCNSVAALPRLKLRGLMAIPAPVEAGQDPRAPYRRLRELFERLQENREQGSLLLDTISAGMSDDFEAAIAEGSTLVRIGTVIFGKRA